MEEGTPPPVEEGVPPSPATTRRAEISRGKRPVSAPKINFHRHSLVAPTTTTATTALAVVTALVAESAAAAAAPDMGRTPALERNTPVPIQEHINGSRPMEVDHPNRRHHPEGRHKRSRERSPERAPDGRAEGRPHSGGSSRRRPIRDPVYSDFGTTRAERQHQLMHQEGEMPGTQPWPTNTIRVRKEITTTAECGRAVATPRTTPPGYQVLATAPSAVRIEELHQEAEAAGGSPAEETPEAPGEVEEGAPPPAEEGVPPSPATTGRAEISRGKRPVSAPKINIHRHSSVAPTTTTAATALAAATTLVAEFAAAAVAAPDMGRTPALQRNTPVPIQEHINGSRPMEVDRPNGRRHSEGGHKRSRERSPERAPDGRAEGRPHSGGSSRRRPIRDVLQTLTQYVTEDKLTQHLEGRLEAMEDRMRRVEDHPVYSDFGTTRAERQRQLTHQEGEMPGMQPRPTNTIRVRKEITTTAERGRAVATPRTTPPGYQVLATARSAVRIEELHQEAEAARGSPAEETPEALGEVEEGATPPAEEGVPPSPTTTRRAEISRGKRPVSAPKINFHHHSSVAPTMTTAATALAAATAPVAESAATAVAPDMGRTLALERNTPVPIQKHINGSRPMEVDRPNGRRHPEGGHKRSRERSPKRAPDGRAEGRLHSGGSSRRRPIRDVLQTLTQYVIEDELTQHLEGRLEAMEDRMRRVEDHPVYSDFGTTRAERQRQLTHQEGEMPGTQPRPTNTIRFRKEITTTAERGRAVATPRTTPPGYQVLATAPSAVRIEELHQEAEAAGGSPAEETPEAPGEVEGGAPPPAEEGVPPSPATTRRAEISRGKRPVSAPKINFHRHSLVAPTTTTAATALAAATAPVAESAAAATAPDMGRTPALERNTPVPIQEHINGSRPMEEVVRLPLEPPAFLLLVICMLPPPPDEALRCAMLKCSILYQPLVLFFTPLMKLSIYFFSEYFSYSCTGRNFHSSPNVRYGYKKAPPMRAVRGRNQRLRVLEKRKSSEVEEKQIVQLLDGLKLEDDKKVETCWRLGFFYELEGGELGIVYLFGDPSNLHEETASWFVLQVAKQSTTFFMTHFPAKDVPRFHKLVHTKGTFELANGSHKEPNASFSSIDDEEYPRCAIEVAYKNEDVETLKVEIKRWEYAVCRLAVEIKIESKGTSNALYVKLSYFWKEAGKRRKDLDFSPKVCSEDNRDKFRLTFPLSWLSANVEPKHDFLMEWDLYELQKHIMDLLFKEY
ncbi:hypothetical protein SELMODRAFT_430862 [Selaginella moellendorffii]|uniref:Uncharacterized protein n=1 Tax=Selaginella moellendorffii TaxID=88036 RepID=D8TAR8_SELML|nr:hypothetical protein SELMODRAFT_430862 [Selaginella moellendorffii]